MPAFTTGGLPAGSTVTIINNGRIEGAGGQGGQGGDGSNNGEGGFAGGDALALTVNVTIDNTSGEIWGGGGGGGGSGGYWNVNGTTTGSGGGGGAGTNAGAGGAKRTAVTYTQTGANGSTGTAMSGGVGGTTSPWAHNGGRGGDPGQSGASGSTGNTVYSLNEGGDYTFGGTGGPAGYAIRSNGKTVAWLGGSSSPNVKGTSDAAAGTPSPSIISALGASGTTGTAFNYTITATNSPTSYSASGLVSGLTINTTNGVINGTPTQSGSVNVTIGATNASGLGVATLALSINTSGSPPSITSALSASGTTAAAFNYTVTATNTPTSYSAGGLPGGLSLNTTTGAINGTPTQAGSFNMTIGANNSFGTGTASLTLVISAPPTITAQPSSQTVTPGGTATFTVGTTGNPTPAYQWRKGSTNISGAINATLTFTNVQSGDAASYSVVVTNSVGSVTSNSVTLTVNTANTTPSITSQPENQTVAQGGIATFTVNAAGNPAPTYQWRKNGTAISSAMGSSLSLSNVQTGDAGNYDVVVTNSVGTATSNVAVLTVNNPVYSLTMINSTAGSSGSTTLTGLTTGTVVEIHANTPPSNMLFGRWTNSGSGTFTEYYSENTYFTVGTENVTLTATSNIPPSDRADVDTVTDPFKIPPPYPPGSGTALSGTGGAAAFSTVIEYYPEIYQYCWDDYVIVDWYYDYYMEEWVPIYDWAEFCDEPIVLFWWETVLFQVANTISGLTYSLAINFADGTSMSIPFIGNGGTRNVYYYTFGNGSSPAPTSSTAERTTTISITGKQAICVGCFTNFLIAVTPAAAVNVALMGGDLPSAVTGTTDSSTGQTTLSTSWLTPGLKTVVATIVGTGISATRNIQVIPIIPPPYTPAWDQFNFIGRIIEPHVQTPTDNPGLLGYAKPRRRYERACNCACADNLSFGALQYRFSGYVQITDYWYRADLLTRNGPVHGPIDRQAIINCEFQHYEVWRQEVENTRDALNALAGVLLPQDNCIATAALADYLVTTYRQLADAQNEALDKSTEPFGPHPRTANQILEQGGFRGL